MSQPGAPKPRRLSVLPPRVATQGTTLAVMQPGSWRTNKQSSTQRGYSYKWQQARIDFLLENPLCVYCQREDKVTLATVVDHIEPHRGDLSLFWNRKNWQSLCKTHHDGQKQREDAGLA